MITELYKTEDIEMLKSRVRKYALLCTLVIAVAVFVSVAMCFLVTEENAMALKIVNILVCCAGGCVSLYLILNCILPPYHREKYISRIMSGSRRSICATVTGTGRSITVSKDILCCEINLALTEDSETVLLCDAELDLPDMIGKEVEFIIVQNKIVGYEVIK